LDQEIYYHKYVIELIFVKKKYRTHVIVFLCSTRILIIFNCFLLELKTHLYVHGRFLDHCPDYRVFAEE